MNIAWHGQSYFEIAAKGANNDVVKIAIDPYGDGIGLKPPKVEADILLITHQHSDHNNKSAIKGDPFIIETPGEYELKGIFIQGIRAFHDNSKGEERGEVVVYTLEAEGIKLCHLSDLGQKELSDEQVEKIGEVDVLITPVASQHSLDAKGAAGIISQIEPRMVIPMHYKIPKLTSKDSIDGVDKFLKLMGAEDTQPEKKLKLSLKDLPQEEIKIVVLEP